MFQKHLTKWPNRADTFGVVLAAVQVALVMASIGWGATASAGGPSEYALTDLIAHTSFVEALSFSSDNRMLISGSSDESIKFWDLTGRSEICSLSPGAGHVASLAFSPDGKRLASAHYDGTIRIWDVLGKKELAALKGHHDPVFSVAFSHDGRLLASASKDRLAKIWDLASFREVKSLSGPKTWIQCVAFSPDDKILAAGDWDGKLWIWETNGWTEKTHFGAHRYGAALSVAFSPDGSILVSGGNDGTLAVWNTDNLSERARVDAHSSSVSAVLFSGDGKTLISCSLDYTIRFWDSTSWHRLATFGREQVTSFRSTPERSEVVAPESHDDIVRSLAISANDELLASGDGNGVIKLWKIKKILDRTAISSEGAAKSP